MREYDSLGIPLTTNLGLIYCCLFDVKMLYQNKKSLGQEINP